MFVLEAMESLLMGTIDTRAAPRADQRFSCHRGIAECVCCLVLLLELIHFLDREVILLERARGASSVHGLSS